MFIAKNNDLIILARDTREELEQALTFMVYTSIEETDIDYQLYNGEYLTPKEIKVKEREHLDALTLTPADVERALYKAKGMDFEDLKALIAEQIPTIDLKALAIEFRARDFYRGATVTYYTAEIQNGVLPAENENLKSIPTTIRLIDTVGALLGYSADDMDYLFENKELPADDEPESTEPVEKELEEIPVVDTIDNSDEGSEELPESAEVEEVENDN